MDRQFRERKERGSFLFPFESYHTQDPTGTFYVSCHWHPDTEIIYLQKGSFHLFVDGESLTVSGETIVFINREELHYLYSAEPGTLYDASVFPLEFLSFDLMDYCQQKYLLPLIRKELAFPRSLSARDLCFEQVKGYFTELARLEKTAVPGYKMSMKAALYQILSCLIRENLLTASARTERAWDIKKLDTMKQIITYMEDHQTERLCLQDAASHFFMTPNYFCKYFKQNFGTGFTSYLNNLRLENACLLLSETGLPVMEISLRCGFENLSYFIRLFKRQKGVTPSAYRKQLAAPGAFSARDFIATDTSAPDSSAPDFSAPGQTPAPGRGTA